MILRAYFPSIAQRTRRRQAENWSIVIVRLRRELRENAASALDKLTIITHECRTARNLVPPNCAPLIKNNLNKKYVYQVICSKMAKILWLPMRNEV